MKIAIIGQKGIPDVIGGVERHVQELSVRLAKKGGDITVYTRPKYCDSRRTDFHGVHLVSLPSVPTKHLDAITHTFFSLLHAMSKRADVIHFQGVGPSLLSFIPRLFSPRTLVVTTFHSIDRYQQKWGFVARLILRFAEWTAVTLAHETIAVSKEIQDYVRVEYNKDITYIPNGISDVPTAAAHLIQSQFNLKRHGYLLVVSRLVPHKGIHYLLDAFAKIATDKQLVIVGSGAFTDAYVQTLEKKAQKDRRVLLCGAQTGLVLEELYANAFAFVHPSSAEGLSITLLEAMNAGCPILASDIRSNAEVLGNRGWYFTCDDVGSLKKQLEQLLELLPNTLQSRGRVAQAYVQKHYHWDDIANQMMALVDAVSRARKIASKRLAVA